MIVKARADLKEALEGDDLEDIKDKIEALNQASMKLGEAMYQSQKAEAGEDESSEDSSGGTGDDEDIVDADFEEIQDDDHKSA